MGSTASRNQAPPQKHNMTETDLQSIARELAPLLEQGEWANAERAPKPSPLTSPLPKPKITIKLKLTRRAHIANLEMCTANRYLAAGSVVDALQRYTHILTNVEGGRGHPCALINRALCYLVLDYPELAVVDTYRAMMGLEWALDPNVDKYNPDFPQYFQTLTFSHMADTRQNSTDPLVRSYWTSEPGWYVGGGKFELLAQPLASIFPYSRREEQDTTSKKHHKRKNRDEDYILTDVLLKAYYRLVLALMKCGGGALEDALFYLDFVRGHVRMSDDDTKQFKMLGDDHIMLQKYHELKEERSHIQQAETSELRAKEQQLQEHVGLPALSRTRFTTIPANLYPECITGGSPSFATFKKQIDSETLQGCKLKEVETEGRQSTLALVAREDTAASTSLFFEDPLLTVTTSNWDSSREPEHYYCARCGAELAVRRTTFICAARLAKQRGCTSTNDLEDEMEDITSFGKEYLVTPRSPPASDGASPTSTTKSIRKDTENMFLESPLLMASQLDGSVDASNSSEEGELNESSDDENAEGFQICSTCHDAVYCDDYCRIKAKERHSLYCAMGLERYSEDTVTKYRYPGVPAPKEQILLKKAVLKIFGDVLYNDDDSVLDADSIRLLDPDLLEARPVKKTVEFNDLIPTSTDLFEGSYLSIKSKDMIEDDDAKKPGVKRIPWSLHQNVRHPLHCLFTMFGAARVMDLRAYDGWMLNMLIAKLRANMRVTEHPRLRKTLDPNGYPMHYALRHADDEVPVDEAFKEIEESSNPLAIPILPIWVGTVHPISSLIKPAGPSEVPNVHLKEVDGQLFCETVEQPCLDPKLEDPISLIFSDSEPGVTNRSSPILRKRQTLIREAEIHPEVPILNPTSPSDNGDVEMPTPGPSMASTMLESQGREEQSDYEMIDV